MMTMLLKKFFCCVQCPIHATPFFMEHHTQKIPCFLSSTNRRRWKVTLISAPMCFWIKKKEFVIPFLQLWRDCRVLVDFGMWNRTTAMVNALYLSFCLILSLVFPIMISFLVCDMRKRIDLLRKRFNHFLCLYSSSPSTNPFLLLPGETKDAVEEDDYHRSLFLTTLHVQIQSPTTLLLLQTKIRK